MEIVNTPRAPFELSEKNYPKVEAAMLSTSEHSFVGQMADIQTYNPSVFLLTAFSSIPVADSIRGFYAELDLKTPRIDYIMPQHSTGIIDRYFKMAERVRLKNRLDIENDKACIVDQYVQTGDTIRRSSGFLADIGLEKAAAIRGKWYKQALRAEIDEDQVTSFHADFMYGVGVKACRLAFDRRRFIVQNTNNIS